MSLRDRFTADMKTAMLAKDEVRLGAIRLIMAALKDKDIAARTADSREGIKDEQILSMLQGMIKQRQESVKMYEQGNRPELAAQETAEIRVIEGYLPKQLSDDEARAAVAGAIAATGAAGIKDMGRVMAELKAKYSGQMDFSKAGILVKEKLAS